MRAANGQLEHNGDLIMMPSGLGGNGAELCINPLVVSATPEQVSTLHEGSKKQMDCRLPLVTLAHTGTPRQLVPGNARDYPQSLLLATASETEFICVSPLATTR
jgi:hypothetical protein